MYIIFLKKFAHSKCASNNEPLKEHLLLCLVSVLWELSYNKCDTSDLICCISYLLDINTIRSVNTMMVILADSFRFTLLTNFYDLLMLCKYEIYIKDYMLG